MYSYISLYTTTTAAPRATRAPREAERPLLLSGGDFRRLSSMSSQICIRGAEVLPDPALAAKAGSPDLFLAGRPAGSRRMFLLPFGLLSSGERSGPPHNALLAHSPAAARSPKSECRGDVRRTIRVRRTGTSCPNPPQLCDFSEDNFNRSHCLPLPLDQPLTDILRTACQNENQSAQRHCLRQNGAAILAPTRTHNRCAVVSSGGAMLGSGCGAQIDSDYDAVFRTNCPVLNGYEQDVGTRTDIMVVNGLISRIMANGSHTVVPGDGETGQPRPLWHDGTVAIMWKFADFNITNDTLNRMRADYNASYVAVRVKDPVNRLFTDSESSVRSSKGIVTILMSVVRCDTFKRRCDKSVNRDAERAFVPPSRLVAPGGGVNFPDRSN